MTELEIYLFGVGTAVLALALIGVLWRYRKWRKGRVKLEHLHSLVRTLRH